MGRFYYHFHAFFLIVLDISALRPWGVKLLDHVIVGAVIEEMLSMNRELNELNTEARELEKIIHHNILKLTGEE